MRQDTGRLHMDTHPRAETAVVTVGGALDLAGCQPLRDHLLKAGTDVPRAVVVDVTDLLVARPALLAIFATAQDRLAEWPGVPMLLVARPGPTADLLAVNRTGRHLPVHGSVAAALAAVDEPPPRRVARLRLPNRQDSCGAARAFTRSTCTEWGVGHLADTAALLVSELTSNAVEHTASAPRLRLELSDRLLGIGVQDDVPGRVSIPDQAGDPLRTHGLLLVAQIARAWGCSPAPGGGKVVWATLRVAPPGTVPPWTCPTG